MSLLWHPAMNVIFVVIFYFDLLWQNKISSFSSKISSCQISSHSYLKRRDLRVFEVSPQEKEQDE